MRQEYQAFKGGGEVGGQLVKGLACELAPLDWRESTGVLLRKCVVKFKVSEDGSAVPLGVSVTREPEI